MLVIPIGIVQLARTNRLFYATWKVYFFFAETLKNIRVMINKWPITYEPVTSNFRVPRTKMQWISRMRTELELISCEKKLEHFSMRSHAIETYWLKFVLILTVTYKSHLKCHSHRMYESENEFWDVCWENCFLFSFLLASLIRLSLFFVFHTHTTIWLLCFVDKK